MKELIPMDEYGIFADRNDTARVNEAVHDALIASSRTLDEALNIVDCTFRGVACCEWIVHCIKETVMRWYLDSRATEQDVYVWFRENISEILPSGARIVKKRNDRSHIPDFWVEIDGRLSPVECKLHEFDKSALDQLKRYMRFYGCRSGIAVASEFTCEVPSEITKVCFDIKALYA